MSPRTWLALLLLMALVTILLAYKLFGIEPPPHMDGRPLFAANPMRQEARPVADKAVPA